MVKNSSIILRIALPKPLRRLFDYLPPQDIDPKSLIPGVRIRVPFQSRRLIGILIEVAENSDQPYEKLKRAEAVLDQAPLFSKDVYELCLWAHDYYHYPLGEVLTSALPSLLRKGNSLPIKKEILQEPKKILAPPALNEAQQIAISTVCHARDHFQVFLLEGITGSGKTEVYLQIIDKILQDGKQILVLLPEIGLTPQTIARFCARFEVPIVALHSHLKESERYQAWCKAQSGNAKIVIGTRSAVFTSFKNLGLIIVDEEHDASFKQQDRFRYHARDLAILRARMNGIPILLGSATPSLETRLNAKRNRYETLSLPYRAGEATVPQYQIVDLTRASQEQGLSTSLLQTIKTHLEEENQVLLFLNRRGYAPILYCISCKWMACCERCNTRLVYHEKPLQLRCHSCERTQIIPPECEQCGEKTLKALGLGTQKIEKILTKYFPDVPIIRLDRDNTKRKGDMERLLNEIHTTPKAILLGTQMLAKGHHFKGVTLVGIIDADHGLLSIDFRAPEQMGQLLMQVAGRAGRDLKKGTVLIQTHYPEHPLLQQLIQQGYASFADTLLNEREKSSLPPFSYFALLKAESYHLEEAHHFLSIVKEGNRTSDSIALLGPLSARLSKRKGLHAAQLIVKANNRTHLQSFLKKLIQKIENIKSHNTVKWTLDVDPIEV